jgi:signal transduction histidine kinase
MQTDDMADAILTIIQEVDQLLMEDRVASAAALLFDTHKERPDIWFQLKFSLLKEANGHRELFLAASIINVAEKDHLSQSFHLVPGLFALRQNRHEY